MQKNENNLFYFSRKEKNGIVLILILNLLIYCWPDVYDYFSNRQENTIQIEKLSEEKNETQTENDKSISSQKRTDHNTTVYEHQNAIIKDTTVTVSCIRMATCNSSI